MKYQRKEEKLRKIYESLNQMELKAKVERMKTGKIRNFEILMKQLYV